MTPSARRDFVVVSTLAGVGIAAAAGADAGGPEPDWFDRADGPAESLSAPSESGGEQAPSGRLSLQGRHHVAATMSQALAVFELAQFGGCIDLDVGIGADTKSAASHQIVHTVEDTVAERGLGQRTESGHGAASRQRVGFAQRHLGRVNQAPSRVNGGVPQQPFDRPRTRRCHAVLHFLHLFGGVDFGPARGSPEVPVAVHDAIAVGLRRRARAHCRRNFFSGVS